MAKMYDCLILSKKDKIGIITMNRPEALNAINLTLASELADCLATCTDDNDINVLILSGNGRAFSVGGDIKAMHEATSRPHFLREITMYAHSAIASIWRMPKPIIAAVHGVATGIAFPLALACDLVFAAEGSRFGSAYLALGLSPDGGTTFLLPRILGLHMAKYIILNNQMIEATEAQRMGFVSKICRTEELMPEAEKMAYKLASGPSLAISKTKILLNNTFDQTMETQMEAERDAIAFNSGRTDFVEGMNAFLEKRAATFIGN